MKKHLFKSLLALFFIGLFVYYYIDNPQVFDEIKKYSLPIILAGFLYNIFFIFVNGLFLKTVVDEFGKKVPQSESFFISFISTFANFFLPFRGGAALRAVHLKRKYNLSYHNFAATLYGNYIIVFLVNSLLALLLLFSFKYFSDLEVANSLIIIMFVIFVVMLSLASEKLRIDQWALGLAKKIPSGPVQRICRVIDRVIDGWKIIISDKRLLFKLLFITVVNILSRAIFYWLVFYSLHLQISIFQTLLFSTVTSLAIFMAVTPGSIGVRETLLLVFSTTLGISNTAILSATLLDRATQLASLALLFVFYQFIARRDLLKKDSWL